MTLEDVFFNCEARSAEIQAFLKPGLRRGWCLQRPIKITWRQLQRQTQGIPAWFIPRCVVCQGSGKQRINDNVHAGGQSALALSRTSSCCAALRPAQHAAAALSVLGVDQAREVLQYDHLEGGVEVRTGLMRTAAAPCQQIRVRAWFAASARNGVVRLSSFIPDFSSDSP